MVAHKGDFLERETDGNEVVRLWCMCVCVCLCLQKRPETPLEPTNPFLEDESEDSVSEKDEDLERVRLFRRPD